jgi:hypothetical protein
VNTASRQDRRRSLRGRIVLPVSLEFDGTTVEGGADLMDLSEYGAFLRTDADLEHGDPIRVSFAFDGNEAHQLYQGEGYVVRKLEGGVAIEFEELNEHLRVFVQRLVGIAEA